MSENIENLINFDAVRERCNHISRPVVDILVKENLFPTKVYISNRVFWRISDIDEFMRINKDFNKSRSKIKWLDYFNKDNKEQK